MRIRKHKTVAVSESWGLKRARDVKRQGETLRDVQFARQILDNKGQPDLDFTNLVVISQRHRQN